MKEKATAEKSTETPYQIHLRRTIEFIWIRIQERFKTFSPAFRFFDRNADGKITFDQFVMALETLKVKLSSKDLHMVFSHLDA
jgi:Ca2+-binding EF-hand superfamily protein